MIDLSIIIVNYNTSALTLACISSVIEKTEGIPYEIVLVDNASVECDPGIFLAKFPDLVLIRSDMNLGFAGGNNLGIRAAKGKYILLLNSDTILKNNAGFLTVQKMKEQKTSLATCRVLNADGSQQLVCSFFPSVRFSLLAFLGIIQLSRKMGWRSTSYKYSYSSEHTVDWIWGCFFLFERNLLQYFDENKLPEDFFMYDEDLLWCYKLKQKGVQAWYYPDGTIYHLYSGGKLTKDPLVNLTFRNYVIFLKRNYVWWRYMLIFFFDTCTSLTRFKWKYLSRKIHLYFTLK